MRTLYAEMLLPFPPSVNHYWRKVPRGMIVSEEGRKYNSRVAMLTLLNGRGDQDYYVRQLAHIGDMPVRVNISAYLPDRRKRDLDNLFKVLFDSFTKNKIWEDDSQVYDIRAIKIPKTDAFPHGSVRVEIYSLYAN